MAILGLALSFSPRSLLIIFTLVNTLTYYDRGAVRAAYAPAPAAAAAVARLYAHCAVPMC